MPMARWARETGVTLRFIEYMDVGHSNGWRLDEVVPAAELDRPRDRGLAGRARRPGYRGEVADRWRYVDGARRVRRHLVGDPAVLPRLHAGPPVGRRQAVHVPVRGRRPRRPGGPPRRVIGRRPAWPSWPTRGAAATTATRSCALGRRRRPAEDRDVRDGRLNTARPQSYPQADHSPDIPVDGRRTIDSMFVDKRVDRRPRSADTVGRARRGRQDRRNRDHIKDLRSAAGRFGRFVARGPRPSHHGPVRGERPTGRDRHPGVDTSVGRDEAAGLPSTPRPTSSCHARTPARRLACRTSVDRRPDPAHPAGRPAASASRALVAAVRERTDLVPEVGIVLGSGSRRPRRRPRGTRRDPVRRAARLAGRDGARPCGAAAAGAARRPVRSSCSRAASTCTRATTRVSSSSRSCCSAPLAPGWSS